MVGFIEKLKILEPYCGVYEQWKKLQAMKLWPDRRGGETLVWGADNEKEQGHKAYEKLLWGFKTLTKPGKIHHRVK